ncbi:MULTISPECIES: terminase large subunit domain-containing protein [Providencia]|uniref:terminase large subunit domain-containing protein n=1 Tax=Providencia TaxID=586 RepID=UPI0022312382|nr:MULTISPECIES: terminase family protein [Providencia]MDM9281852.1 terminase family protein [Providencia rettgeri]MDX7422030.1 terminase family protein [Providencia sp. CIM-Carb-044]
MTLKMFVETINVTSELLFSLQKEQMNFLPWQKRWYQTRFLKNRSLKKGRQIGADYYFLFEALQDACLTGRNKIFFGNVPVHYLLKHAKIKEIRIAHNYLFKLTNGANIYVFNPEYLTETTFAGISGDVYISEWSWISNLRNIIQLSGAISMHDKWRITLYTFRSRIDICSILGNSYLSDELLSKNHYQDTVQNSEYEVGNLFLINEEKMTQWKRFGDEIANEMIFCCFNDN